MTGDTERDAALWRAFPAAIVYHYDHPSEGVGRLWFARPERIKTSFYGYRTREAAEADVARSVIETMPPIVRNTFR